MKRILLLALVAAFCIPGKCFASPRASAHTDTIRISNITTTHIRFSSEIKYVDLSSRVLAAKIVDGSRDIIALKAREPFDFTTTMSCLEANGAMHTFLVQFEEYPKELVIEAGARTVSDEPARQDIPVSGTATLEAALAQPKSLYHIGARDYGISILCDNIFIKDDVMYVVLSIENRSTVSYTLSEPRFSIESKRRTSRGLVYEKQIFPKNVLGLVSVAPGTTVRAAFSFDKVSVLKGQVLRAYLYEAGGSRNYVLTFSEKDINQAIPLK